MARARQGDLDTRALAQTAYRLHLVREAFREIGVGARDRLGVGPFLSVEPMEMTVEEEAGSILEAEMANDLSLLRQFYEAVHKQ